MIVRYVDWGVKPAWWLGIAWREPQFHRNAWLPIPFNIPVAFIRWFWVFLRFESVRHAVDRQLRLEEERRNLVTYHSEACWVCGHVRLPSEKE